MEFKRNNQRITRPEGRVTVPTRPRVGVQLPKSITPEPQAPIKLLDEEPHKSVRERTTDVKKAIFRSKRRLAVIFGLVLIVGFVGTHLPKTHPKVAVQGAQTNTHGATDLPRNQTPDFKTILPAGKTIAMYGGWTRVSPPDRAAVFAYADKLGGVPINISEQQLPENLKTEDSDLSKLAKDFNAGETLKVQGITVHIGTSAKGPQSVIFSKNNLLILIRSTSKISNESWAKYISSLQ